MAVAIVGVHFLEMVLFAGLNKLDRLLFRHVLALFVLDLVSLHELHGVIRSDLLLLACGFILYDFGVLVNLLNRGFVERDLLLSGAAAHRGTIAHR